MTSVRDSEAKRLRYILRPSDEKRDGNDLVHQRITAMVRKALHLAGLEEVQDSGNADATIYYDYSLERSYVTATTYYTNGFPISAGTQMTYSRWVALKAVTSDKKVLWQSSIRSFGSSSDFSKVLPGLLGGFVPYIGKEIAGEKEIRIDMDDPRVEYFLGLRNEDGTRTVE